MKRKREGEGERGIGKITRQIKKKIFFPYRFIHSCLVFISPSYPRGYSWPRLLTLVACPIHIFIKEEIVLSSVCPSLGVFSHVARELDGSGESREIEKQTIQGSKGLLHMLIIRVNSFLNRLFIPIFICAHGLYGPRNLDAVGKPLHYSSDEMDVSILLVCACQKDKAVKILSEDMVEGEVVGRREGVDQLSPEGEKCREETGTNRRIHFTKDNRDKMVDMRVVVVMVESHGSGDGTCVYMVVEVVVVAHGYIWWWWWL